MTFTLPPDTTGGTEHSSDLSPQELGFFKGILPQ